MKYPMSFTFIKLNRLYRIVGVEDLGYGNEDYVNLYHDLEIANFLEIDHNTFKSMLWSLGGFEQEGCTNFRYKREVLESIKWLESILILKELR